MSFKEFMIFFWLRLAGEPAGKCVSQRSPRGIHWVLPTIQILGVHPPRNPLAARVRSISTAAVVLKQRAGQINRIRSSNAPGFDKQHDATYEH